MCTYICEFMYGPYLYDVNVVYIYAYCLTVAEN